jgi:ABC-2 type transport system ATP-binding protein
MDHPVIKVENVQKVFKLPHEKQSSLKSAFVNVLSSKKGYELQEALVDISFEVGKGEFFGIVGRNGSGKSTLLKLLAGIYAPTSGTIQVNGSLTPFIELGVGFNPELTGRENIYLNGALLGFNRKEMQKMYKGIVEFAELEKFMDQKLKNYSSGMQVRLAFSIAIRARSDILILDEVLAVGDLDFQRKCYNYFTNLKKNSQTVVIVTHDMMAIRRYCTKAVLINDGKLIKSGSPNEVADLYEELNLRQAEKSSGGSQLKKKRQGNGAAIIKSAETFNHKTKKAQKTFKPSEKIGVRIAFEAKEIINSPTIGYIFQNETDLTVFAVNNHVVGVNTQSLAAGGGLVMEAEVDNIFTNGDYTITCAIESEDLMTVYDRIEYIHKFVVGGQPLAHALTHPANTMDIKYEAVDE